MTKSIKNTIEDFQKIDYPKVVVNATPGTSKLLMEMMVKEMVQNQLETGTYSLKK